MEYLDNWEEEFEVCIYSKKLLDKVTYLNNRVKALQVSVDIREVKKAIYYAKKYHGDQMRQSGEPFYSHPLEVAYIVADYLFRTDIIITAILHDTIEDTKLTKEMIAKIFGDKVANQVEDLTRIKTDRKISSAEMVELLYKEKKHDVLLVKLCDRLHNMQTIYVKSPEKIEKIVTETLQTFLVLAVFLNIVTIEKHLSKYCLNTTCDNHNLMYYYDITDSFQLPSLT